MTNETNQINKLLTFAQVAELLAFKSIKPVQKLIKEGKLNVVYPTQAKRDPRITTNNLKNFIQKLEETDKITK